jgi:hypothetical protein
LRGTYLRGTRRVLQKLLGARWPVAAPTTSVGWPTDTVPLDTDGLLEARPL